MPSEKVICLCHTPMESLKPGQTADWFECPTCKRILVRNKSSGYQSWYVPEAALRGNYHIEIMS